MIIPLAAAWRSAWRRTSERARRGRRSRAQTDLGSERWRAWAASVSSAAFRLARSTTTFTRPDNVVWVDVQDPGPAEIATLIDEFGLHPLALEDAAGGERRPKANEFKGYLLLVTYAAIPGEETKGLRTAEVDLFIGRNYVVTIHRGRVPRSRRP